MRTWVQNPVPERKEETEQGDEKWEFLIRKPNSSYKFADPCKIGFEVDILIQFCFVFLASVKVDTKNNSPPNKSILCCPESMTILSLQLVARRLPRKKQVGICSHKRAQKQGGLF